MTQDNPQDPLGTPPPSDSVPPPAQPVEPVDYQSSTSGYTGPPPDQDSRTMGMLCHLLGILTWFIGPLIIWLIKKDQSAFVNDQGKEALNFQITLFLAYFIGGLTACVVVGFVIILIAWVCAIIFGIMGAIAANRGEAYRYPFAIRLLK
jgi:uncharacterized protein